MPEVTVTNDSDGGSADCECKQSEQICQSGLGSVCGEDDSASHDKVEEKKLTDCCPHEAAQHSDLEQDHPGPRPTLTDPHINLANHKALPAPIHLNTLKAQALKHEVQIVGFQSLGC